MDDNDDFLWVIIDDDGNVLTPWEDEEHNEIEETISGLNIITGCYGLFLIADEKTTNHYEDALVVQAFDALEDLKDHTDIIAEATYDVFPPDDLSQNGILQLAKMIVELRDHIDNHPGTPQSETMDATTKLAKINDLEYQLDELLEDIEQLQKEIDDEQKGNG